MDVDNDGVVKYRDVRLVRTELGNTWPPEEAPPEDDINNVYDFQIGTWLPLVPEFEPGISTTKLNQEWFSLPACTPTRSVSTLTEIRSRSVVTCLTLMTQQRG